MGIGLPDCFKFTKVFSRHLFYALRCLTDVKKVVTILCDRCSSLFCFGPTPFAGLVRNDIYVTLEHGVFEKGSKRAERNVEVAIAVVNSSGQILPVGTRYFTRAKC